MGSNLVCKDNGWVLNAGAISSPIRNISNRAARMTVGSPLLNWRSMAASDRGSRTRRLTDFMVALLMELRAELMSGNMRAQLDGHTMLKDPETTRYTTRHPHQTYTGQFKAELVAACQLPGASIAALPSATA